MNCMGERKIHFWSLRSLTLEGKALIIKYVIVPILLYLFYVFPTPDRVLKRVIKECFTFLWRNWGEKVMK